VYLADAALYVSVRPDTMLTKAETRRWSKDRALACDKALEPDGGTRLMVALQGDLSGAMRVTLAVDLRPMRRGQEFADEVLQWFDGHSAR
jgi:hypothetical protein